MNQVIDYPSNVEIQISNIPEELKVTPHWLLWRWVNRNGKPTKPPFQPSGASGKANDPQTWSTFDAVMGELVKGKYSGVGFVLTEDTGLVAWDLDHCLNPKTGELASWAENIVESLKSYTEITPSGEGLRIFSKGNIPKAGTKKGPIECYKDKRYVTVTGNTFRYNKIISADNEGLFSKIFVASDKDKHIELLQVGKWKEAGYPSQSEADLAFCSYLARRCNGDPIKIDELFRQCKLFRPKWDVQHHADGTTYGQTTIKKALENYSIWNNLNLTDLGNAYRLSHLGLNRIKNCAGSWFVWDGKRFKRDTRNEIIYFAEEVVKTLREEAMKFEDKDVQKAYLKYATACESVGKLESMIKLAASRRELSIDTQELDQDIYAINFNNGTLLVDDFVQNDPIHKITKLVPYEYRTADCPMWEEFLRVVLPDPEVRDFVQRCVGYSITGSIQEQKLFFLYGGGANGKSTFIDVIQNIFGEYCVKIPSELLVVRNNMDGNSYGLADLRGARIAIASETENSRRLNESLVKTITGDGMIKARFLYKDFFEFRSTAKLWIIGNHKPVIRGTDLGIWRRILLIPFTVTIPEEQQDKNLLDKLMVEADGIINWAIEGLIKWRKDGLKAPTAVVTATEEYKEEEDYLNAFFQEFCDADPNNTKYKVLHSALYDRYVKWAEANNEHIFSSKQFANALRDKGYSNFRGSANKMYWHGIQLRLREDGSVVEI